MGSPHVAHPSRGPFSTAVANYCTEIAKIRNVPWVCLACPLSVQVTREKYRRVKWLLECRAVYKLLYTTDRHKLLQAAHQK